MSSLLLAGLLLTMASGQPEDTLRFELIEEVPVGTRIADLTIEAGLKMKYPPAILQQLKFGFLSKPRANISVGSDIGLLFTKGRIDRDVLCPSMEVCEEHLDISVQPVDYFQIIRVTVAIVDLNDNRPEFPEPEITLSILESAPAGSAFVLPSATDNDSPPFGISNYQLISDATKSKFSLKVNKNFDGSMDVRLVLERRLDREAHDRYDVKVIAYDGGPNKRAGTLVVNIHVIDTNDNEPVFDQTSYSVSVMENTMLHTIICRVHAEDQDQGPNGIVRYGFSEHTRTQHGHLFGIDQDTGDVYVKGTIDHEVAPVYHLMVTAQDLGPDSLPTDATIVVHVQDVNDNKPEITINTLTESDTDRAEIAEDAPVGTFIAHVSVKDADAGLNGEFNCNLNNKAFALERRYPTEYQIVTNKTLDRELMPTYSLAIVCRDKGKDTQMEIEHLHVSVTDQNDNYPIFSAKTYTASLIENNAIGVIVLRVNATDMDMGENARITYELDRSKDSRFFQIDNQGVIRVTYSIDREVYQKFQFRVLASDNGSPRRTGSAQVIVIVEDKNDEHPEFTLERYIFRVRENQPAGITVGVVSATDNDNPPYNKFLYSFSDRNAGETFEVDPISGIIKTKKSLDRERHESYHLIMMASDEGNPEISGTADVTVFVEDVNDNSPIFLFPSYNNNSLTISSQIPLGYTITKLRARDSDVGVNGRLNYTITAGNDNAAFSLDSQGGTLTLHTRLANIGDRRFTLSVEVRDNGNPSLRAEGTLHIQVNKSIPFPVGQSSQHFLSGHNLIIVISLAGALLIIITVVVLTICLVRRQGKNQKRRRGKKEKQYHCRMQALKDSSGAGSGGTTGPSKSLPLNGATNRQGYKSLADVDKQPLSPPKQVSIFPCFDILQMLLRKILGKLSKWAAARALAWKFEC